METIKTWNYGDVEIIDNCNAVDDLQYFENAELLYQGKWQEFMIYRNYDGFYAVLYQIAETIDNKSKEEGFILPLFLCLDAVPTQKMCAA